MKVEIETLKKTQTDIKLDRKTLESQIKSSEISLTNRVQDKEVRESYVLKRRWMKWIHLSKKKKIPGTEHSGNLEHY